MWSNALESTLRLTSSHVMLNVEQMNSEREINVSLVLKAVTLVTLKANVCHVLPTRIAISSVMRLE